MCSQPEEATEMEYQQLHETLERLHAQLRETEKLPPEALAELAEVDRQIDAILARQGGESRAQGEPVAAQPGEESVAERLREAAQEFEQSHPTLAGTLHRLVDTLAQMGI